VNRKEYLADDTGNRRFWTVECLEIDYEHKLDMQQVWAQVMSAYKKGEIWWLANGEMKALNESNENFSSIDPIEEKLRVTYMWETDFSEANWKGKTATEISDDLGLRDIGRMELNNVASRVRKLNGNREKKSNGRKMLLVPPKVDAVHKMREF
jgi:putative DNA primase/helicase